MRNKRTKEEFIILSKIVHGDKYDYTNVDYIGDKIKVKIICPLHGDFWQRPTNHIVSKQGCRKCNQKKPLTTEEFIEKAKTIHGDKYSYSLVDYKDSKTKIKIVCPSHGEFLQTPKSHLNRDGCLKCRKPDVNTFIEKAKTIHGDKYDYSLVDYKDAKTKIEIVCPVHGVFKQKINDHLYGNGCPICRESKGEKEIRLFLENNSIKYKPQYRFKDCRDKNPLPFDFYLSDYNICLEYHGKQHYEFMSFFHKTEKTYHEQIKRDDIKKEYCYNNKIKLIIISEFDDVIEILTNNLIKNE